MKKTIFISFLLLAHILILAHAVIPHHHNNAIIVAIFDNHCVNELDNHYHAHDCDFEPDTHDHHSSNNVEKCVLN